MGNLIDLSPGQPIRVTADADQPLWSARDVLSYDVLRLQLAVLGGAGSMTGTLKLKLITGLDTDTDESSWLATATNFANIDLTMVTFPYYEIVTIKGGFLRYVRWRNTDWAGHGLSAVTFTIHGAAFKGPAPQ